MSDSITVWIDATGYVNDNRIGVPVVIDAQDWLEYQTHLEEVEKWHDYWAGLRRAYANAGLVVTAPVTDKCPHGYPSTMRCMRCGE